MILYKKILFLDLCRQFDSLARDIILTLEKLREVSTCIQHKLYDFLAIILFLDKLKIFLLFHSHVIQYFVNDDIPRLVQTELLKSFSQYFNHFAGGRLSWKLSLSFILQYVANHFFCRGIRSLISKYFRWHLEFSLVRCWAQWLDKSDHSSSIQHLLFNRFDSDPSGILNQSIFQTFFPQYLEVHF